MGKLDGKVAVITGGSTGIGLATAQRFVSEGAYVFITGRRQAELDAAVRRIGENVTAVQGDVSNLADLDRLYETVRREKGYVDIVFANAGIGEIAPIGEITEEHFDRQFGVNVRGLLFTVQKALPLFRDGGAVVLNASTAASGGFAAFSVYSASKAAVRSFARSWSLDLMARKIRVNVVSPGPTATPILSAFDEATIAHLTSRVPMGRMGDPDEVAKAVLFLASDDSSFTTGSELFVDGGLGQV